MKNLIKIVLIMPVLLALLLAGCSLDDPADPTGTVNEPTVDDAGARYVAIGNSLTSGFMDGGLMQAGQINSYPRLIANQLGLDNTEFSQPWIKTPGIGSSAASDAAHVAGVLHFDGVGISVLKETPLADVQSKLLLAGTQPTPYHNMGVPGAVLADGLHAYSAVNSISHSPFFDFINRASFFGNTTLTATLPDGAGGSYDVDYASASMTYQSIATGGALATMWLGNNDVLGPATSGDPTPDFGPAGATAFQADFTSTLSVLAGGLAQRNGAPSTIVVANIPDIQTIPYFVPLEDFLKAIGGAWPAGFAEDDVQLVLFPALSWVKDPANLTTALPSNFTLTSAEETDIDTAVGTYNQVIAGVAQAVNASGLAKVGVYDANGTLAGLSDAQRTHFLFLLGAGMDVATAAGTTIFSLDGIHPNNVGYGIVANGFIEVINEIDGTSIPAVDLGSLSWDPTYGGSLGETTGTGTLSPAAAEAMVNLFN